MTAARCCSVREGMNRIPNPVPVATLQQHNEPQPTQTFHPRRVHRPPTQTLDHTSLDTKTDSTLEEREDSHLNAHAAVVLQREQAIHISGRCAPHAEWHRLQMRQHAVRVAPEAISTGPQVSALQPRSDDPHQPMPSRTLTHVRRQTGVPLNMVSTFSMRLCNQVTVVST